MKLRIFVIDDEESIRETMKWHLEEQGHEVLVAPEPLICDVYLGCKCVDEYACGDILFVDYKMPRMTGLEFVELMAKRGCKGLTENKIIMSGDTTAIDIAKVEKLGCKVVQKPLSLSEVDKIVAVAKKRLHPDRRLADLSKKST